MDYGFSAFAYASCGWTVITDATLAASTKARAMRMIIFFIVVS
jgi:hypothetical protein